MACRNKPVSETVDAKVPRAVDLMPFACTDTPHSSFTQRVCYDKTQSYMLISLRGTYYHYCELPRRGSNPSRSTAPPRKERPATANIFASRSSRKAMKFPVEG